MDNLIVLMIYLMLLVAALGCCELIYRFWIWFKGE